MSAADFDILVIGAGVIGLAIAERLAASGNTVLLIEREARIGMGSSSRNTGCIHAGAYYHRGSLKARLCARGRELLYAHCRRHGVAHRRTGKIFLATSARYTSGLESIKSLAAGNGLDDLVEIDGADIPRFEPALRGDAALLCPQSGVVDTQELMVSLLGLAEAGGVIFVPQTRAVGASHENGAWTVALDGLEATTIRARLVVNAGGIWAPELSRAVFPGRQVPPPKPVKGSYLRLGGVAVLSHIVYPDLVPGEITERVDATPGMDGALRFGPTVDETAGADDYTVAPGLAERLAPLIRRYLPDVDETRLTPDFAGVRPKIETPKGMLPDFVFEWAPEPGWLDLWGIESPGLTSALAIGEHVDSMVRNAGLN